MITRRVTSLKGWIGGRSLGKTNEAGIPLGKAFGTLLGVDDRRDRKITRRIRQRSTK